MPEIPDLSGVVFSAAIDSDGRLGPVAGLEDKLRAMVHGHVARPHTLVVAERQPLGPEWRDYLVEHAGLRLIKADTLDEALALVAHRQGALRLVETTADAQLPPSPGTRIPRPWLFEQLDEALEQLAKQAPAGQLPRGYVVLEAPAGSGKSQLLAEYVRREQARGLDRDCLAWHFIRRHESGRDDQHRFLRQLARQICLHRGLPVPDAESELRQSPAVELQDSLSKAAIELDRPMVVVIDALDEAFGQGSAAPQADLGHLLPTGDALPAGVILLVSTRPGEAYLDSFPRGPRVILSMDTPTAVKDVQAYIDSVDDKYTLGLEPTLKQQLAARCGANLMLATSLLQRAASRDANERARWQSDLEAWRQAPSSIPDEPLRYLNQEWQRLGQAAAARGMNLPPAEARLAVLALLGLFRYAVRPLARTELTALLGTLQEDEGPLGVQAPEWLGQYRRLKAWLSLPLLDDLLALASVFLDQPAGQDGASPGYRIANATFSDYVDARLTEQGWEKDLHGLLGFGASFWASARHGEWLRHYAVAALPHHLYQAGQAKLTEQVLTDPPYLQAVYDALGDGALPALEEYLEQLIIDDDPDIRTDRLDNVWGVLAYHHRMLAKGHMWVAATLYNDLGGLDDPHAPWASPPPPDPKRPALIREKPGQPRNLSGICWSELTAGEMVALSPCKTFLFTYSRIDRSHWSSRNILRQYQLSKSGRRLSQIRAFELECDANHIQVAFDENLTKDEWVVALFADDICSFYHLTPRSCLPCGSLSLSLETKVELVNTDDLSIKSISIAEIADPGINPHLGSDWRFVHLYEDIYCITSVHEKGYIYFSVVPDKFDYGAAISFRLSGEIVDATLFRVSCPLDILDVRRCHDASCKKTHTAFLLKSRTDKFFEYDYSVLEIIKDCKGADPLRIAKTKISNKEKCSITYIPQFGKRALYLACIIQECWPHQHGSPLRVLPASSEIERFGDTSYSTISIIESRLDIERLDWFLDHKSDLFLFGVSRTWNTPVLVIPNKAQNNLEGSICLPWSIEVPTVDLSDRVEIMGLISSGRDPRRRFSVLRLSDLKKTFSLSLHQQEGDSPGDSIARIEKATARTPEIGPFSEARLGWIAYFIEFFAGGEKVKQELRIRHGEREYSFLKSSMDMLARELESHRLTISNIKSIHLFPSDDECANASLWLELYLWTPPETVTQQVLFLEVARQAYGAEIGYRIESIQAVHLEDFRKIGNVECRNLDEPDKGSEYFILYNTQNDDQRIGRININRDTGEPAVSYLEIERLLLGRDLVDAPPGAKITLLGKDNLIIMNGSTGQHFLYELEGSTLRGPLGYRDGTFEKHSANRNAIRACKKLASQRTSQSNRVYYIGMRPGVTYAEVSLEDLELTPRSLDLKAKFRVKTFLPFPEQAPLKESSEPIVCVGYREIMVISNGMMLPGCYYDGGLTGLKLHAAHMESETGSIWFFSAENSLDADDHSNMGWQRFFLR